MVSASLSDFGAICRYQRTSYRHRPPKRNRTFFFWAHRSLKISLFFINWSRFICRDCYLRHRSMLCKTAWSRPMICPPGRTNSLSFTSRCSTSNVSTTMSSSTLSVVFRPVTSVWLWSSCSRAPLRYNFKGKKHWLKNNRRSPKSLVPSSYASLPQILSIETIFWIRLLPCRLLCFR